MPVKVTKEHFRWTNGRGHGQKPVLYSQKTNTFGLGKKAHDADHWWATAFDNQLKSLNVSKSAGGNVKVQQTDKATPLGMTKASRYYIRFVSGGLLTGTIKDPVVEEEVSATATPITSDGEDRGKKAMAKEKRKNERKAAKKAKRDKEGKKAKRDKEGKKAKREEDRKRLKQDEDGKKAKRKRKDTLGEEDETKEQRRQKKRLKRLVEKQLAALAERYQA